MGVHLIHGSDAVLVSEQTSQIVRQLVGEQDRALVLEEFSGDFVMAGVTEAAQTPPFFTDRRVIVLRRDQALTADDVAVLVDYLASPAEFTDLVIEWGSGKVSEALKKAVKAAGGQVVDPSPPTRAKDRREWWETQVAERHIDLDGAAMSLLVDWLGEDVGRLESLADTLAATYGSRRVSADMLRPFLGERGDAQPWDLTDSIDKGNATEALRAARRMMNAGERHPLQILAQLHGHYTRLAKLDGRDFESTAELETILGVKGYPAQKAATTYRAIGHDALHRAFELLARADSDLRGGTGLDEDVVMDVLVARLARLAPMVSRRR